jgi:F0F1-type ATP synthase assembly protein I
LFFVLGAAAGILNVIRAAREINANMARNGAERGD